MSEDQEPEILDLYAEAFFSDEPSLAFAALAEAWGREGYECEELPPQEDESLRGFRGGTFVVLGAIKAIEHGPLRQRCAPLAALDFDFEQTYLIDPKKALADYQGARYSVRVRLRVEAPADRRVCHADLACALLGLDQCCPLAALWLEGPQLLVGRDDLDEYLAYQNTQDGAKPRLPHSLMFAVNLVAGDRGVQGWTKGLDFFGHPELLVEPGAFEAADAARVLYNSALHVTNGNRYGDGESLSTGSLRCRIEGATSDGEPALRLVLA